MLWFERTFTDEPCPSAAHQAPSVKTTSILCIPLIMYTHLITAGNQSATFIIWVDEVVLIPFFCQFLLFAFVSVSMLMLVLHESHLFLLTETKNENKNKPPYNKNASVTVTPTTRPDTDATRPEHGNNIILILYKYDTENNSIS